MKTVQIGEVRRFKPVALSDVPDGEYEGLWTGYAVQVEINGENYEFITEKACYEFVAPGVIIQGLNTACRVIVAGAVATAEVSE